MTTETRTDAHTPGPWRVIAQRHTEDIWTDESHGSVKVAECAGMDKSANARLMAAAPDLLEALRELELRTSQFIDGTLVTFPAALLPQVRATIAHATGEVTP